MLSGKLLSCVKLAFYVTGVKSSRLTPLKGQCVQFHTKLDDVSKALVELQKESSRLGGPCGFLRSLAGFAGGALVGDFAQHAGVESSYVIHRLSLVKVGACVDVST